MHHTLRLLVASCSAPLILLVGCASMGSSETHVWPQAAGPDATWKANAAAAPTSWSAARNENIAWRTPLPNAGQGGIAVTRDKLFVETFARQDPNAPRQSNEVLCHALDRATGKLRWSVSLKGGRASPQLYAFSDSTSWTPIADESRVWFFNSGGLIACYDHDGHELWRQGFPTQPEHFPFNRQCEPILAGDDILIVAPLADDARQRDPAKAEWNYLQAFDKTTGRLRWIAEDACTFYCTPCMGTLADGRRAVLVGRGGPHGVPETPIGLSMISLAEGEEGKAIWRFSPAASEHAPLDGTTWMALYTLHFDEKYAYWFRNAPEEAHVVLDASTGALVREQPLARTADVRRYSAAGHGYQLFADANIRKLDDPSYPLAAGESLHVLPEWHANIVANGYHWFLCTTNNRRNGYAPPGHSGPAHALGRVHVETGRVEYLELPVGVAREPGAKDIFRYGESLRTKTVDDRGIEIADEDRSRTDGWEIDAFFPSPVVLGDKLYITTALGVTYVIDTKAAALDARALLSVSDLGPLGDTWSMSGPSYADGALYHRNAREIMAIRETPATTR